MDSVSDSRGSLFDGSSQQKLARSLGGASLAEVLFDRLSDVVFFVKDLDARYIAVNTTLVQRCACRRKSELIGRTPLDVFPPTLGAAYLAQDQQVIRSGRAIYDRLELQPYPNRAPGWCLTQKIPLFDSARRVTGLAGISKDLRMPDENHVVYRSIVEVAAYIHARYAEPLKLAELAKMARLSQSQLQRYIQRIFDLTTKQLIIKTRLDVAAQQLQGDASLADIAGMCGYADQSAFSRQFKKMMGISPLEYRILLQSHRTAP